MDGGTTVRRPRLVLGLALVAASLGAGCTGSPAADAAGLDWGFREVTDESGISHLVGTELPDTGSPYATLLGGVSVADVDGDGWRDVLVADADRNEFYLNDGDGTFTEATNRSGIPTDTTTKMGLFLDHDNDGDPDLFLANHAEPSRLLRNDGDGTFTDVTEEAGVGNATRAYHAAAADVDGDGFLDISVGNYGPRKAPGPRLHADATNGDRDLLYINQGNGTFEEVGVEAGLHATRWTFSHAWNDHDRDGDPDLYMNVDFGYDLLYENDGTGNFTPVTREAGVVTNRNGMGARWVDHDADGDLDVFVTNIHVPGEEDVPQFRGNNLWENQGDGTFRDVADQAGIAEGGWGWDSGWGDLDHDGDLDAVQANGMISMPTPDVYYDVDAKLLDQPPPGRSPDHAKSQPYNRTKWLLLEWDDSVRTPVRRPSLAALQTDRVYENQGDGTFRDVAGPAGLDDPSDSRAVPLADLDRDGDLDLIRTAFLRNVQVHENTAVDGGTPSDARWLQVELVGTDSNRDAVGARLVAEVRDRTLLRRVDAGGGFLSQGQGALHLGLGESESVDTLRVEWPSGETATFEDVAADQAIRITEPDKLATGVWGQG